ncbi:hypothetical protein GX51_01081 [Blastomyces parvus]|uniref:F-box domain-containing protein n=1 Tax=Blastomyces parvus TaxID=2060905 RepID=A0A2B7XIP2_9EURO|nr:hypothetical protein GX51_01081 [Blastomyces parvus]
MKPRRPVSKEEKRSPRKFSLRPLRETFSRWLRSKSPEPESPEPVDDHCTHGSQLTCSQCKYSSFNGDKYCPKMYQHHITPGEVDNSKNSILHRLPPEIVSLVIGHLKPFEVECLRYVCRLFYHNYPSLRAPTMQGKFELACLLEQEPWSKKLACKVCPSRRHHKSMFFPIDWDRNPHNRKCNIYRGGLLQFCPYSSVNFDDMVQLVRNKSRPVHFPKCSHDAFDLALALQGRTCRFEDEAWTIVRWRTYKVLANTALVAIYHTATIPSITDAGKAFKALDIPLCPHVHLGDPWVIEKYRPDLVALHMLRETNNWDCHCLHCRGFMCRFCDSKFKFRVHCGKEPVASACIGVSIMRNLGKLKNPNDPYWLSQLSVPNLPDFRTAWSDRIATMHLNFTVGVPRGDFERAMLSRTLESKAEDVLSERDDWTKAPLGSLRANMRTLHKPLWKPRMSRQDRKYWRWEGYGPDGYLIDKAFSGECGTRDSLSLK